MTGLLRWSSQKMGGAFAKPTHCKEGREKRTWLNLIFGNKMLNAQVAIMAILGTLVVGMTVVIWFHLSKNVMENVAHIALPLRTQLLMRTAGKLEFMLGGLYDSLVTAQNTLQSDLITTTEVPKSGDLWSQNQVLWAMWPAISANAFCKTLSYVRKTEGDVVTITRNNTNYPWAFVQNNTQNNPSFKWYGRACLLKDGRVFGPLKVTALAGNAQAKDSYTDVANKPNMALSLAVTVEPLYTALAMSTRSLGGGPYGNQTDGVLMATMSLKSLGEYIGTMDLQKGFMYITNQMGQVFAVTPGISPTGMDTSTGRPILIPATKLNHSIIPEAAKYLESRVNISKMLVEELHFSNVRIRGHRFYIETTFVKWKSFLAVVVLVVPRRSIMGVVDKGMKTLTIFLFVLAAGTLIVGQILVMLLTRHMRGETRLRAELAQEHEAKARVEACSTSARLFLANLSHDLRTPMSAVVSVLRMVCVHNLGSEHASLMEQAQGNASTLEALVSSVLDISQVERGELKLNLAPLNLVDELQTLVDQFSLEAMSTGVDVLLDLPNKIPIVLGDKKRVHQIFTNLLSNCIKFTTKGHVIIRGSIIDGTQKKMGTLSVRGPLRTSDLAECALHIAFTVEDTGKEIPDEHKELLFENFVSAPDNHSRYGGTGVGLGIVRSLVQPDFNSMHLHRLFK